MTYTKTTSKPEITKKTKDNKRYRQMFLCKKIVDKVKFHQHYNVLGSVSGVNTKFSTIDYILEKLKSQNYENIYLFAWEFGDLFNTLKARLEMDSVEYAQVKEIEDIYLAEFEKLDKEEKDEAKNLEELKNLGKTKQDRRSK